MKNDKILTKIIENNLKREEGTFLEYACKNSGGKRKYPAREKLPDKENFRPIFFHDTDKIIHSRAYSRYVDKTQVFYLFKNDHITHRVLHVQFVSKIGRVLGRALRLNEDLIEAIALGHDLGHVPYGHEGETALDEICQKNKIGGFCHNVQSTRFLMELEQKGKGLNLSLQVLDGILAHNGEIISRKYKPEYKKTWKKFEEEYKKCLKEKNYSQKITPMTMEGCVVKIADIIAYIGRDIEDAITLKLIERRDIPAAIKRALGDKNDKIINTLVLDLIKNSSGKNYLALSGKVSVALKNLMNFNYKNIYLNPQIKTQKPKIKKMFEWLFKKYCQDLRDKNALSPIYSYWEEMNGDYRRKTAKKRVAIDFIAGMTDNFFNNQCQNFFAPKSYGYFLKTREKE